MTPPTLASDRRKKVRLALALVRTAVAESSIPVVAAGIEVDTNTVRRYVRDGQTPSVNIAARIIRIYGGRA